MQSKRQLDPDVLIVGAGPTGLLLACELLRHGLKVRIIDVGEGPPLCSKAQFIQTRTLEILEQMGIVERFLALGRPLYGLSLYSPDMKRLFHFNIGEMDSRYPFTLSLPQNDTEQLLIKHLADLGGHIECPVRFLGLTQTDDRVTVRVQRVQDDEDPEIDEIRAAWVVGCDGAHSAVRHCLGIDFCGNTYEQRIIQADVRIDWPLRHAEDEIIGFLSPRGPTMAVPLPGEQRYRLLGFDTGLAPTLGSFQFLLDERSAAGARVSDPVWMIEYAIHCRMAAQFRIGRVFLAGDAAHTVNPVTSQGMNTGMQDAYNLAWKLSLVQKGLARPVLLGSYEAERMPVAAALLKAPDAVVQELGSLLARYSQVAQGLRGSLLSFVAEMGLVERRTSRGLSMLELGYRNSPSVGQTEPQGEAGQSGSSSMRSLREWLHYGYGPAPGERAPDVGVLSDGTRKDLRLFELIGGTKHSLLLFPGVLSSDEGPAHLTDLGAQISHLYPGLIRTFLITIEGSPRHPSRSGWNGPALVDQGGLMHQIYGARTNSLYLIRPDGYVAFRSQPIDAGQFTAYLSKIFT
mgnify:FL=1